jgi:hypothetical protein
MSNDVWAIRERAVGASERVQKIDRQLANAADLDLAGPTAYLLAALQRVPVDARELVLSQLSDVLDENGVSAEEI